jgi:hypothetical protein
MPFANTWSALRKNLSAGTVIPNWTVDKGALGEPFKVVAVTSTQIEVDAPGAQTRQKVPVADFEEVYNLWDGYRHKAMPRSGFSPLTRYSKYIISILHWLEGISQGRLP